MHKNLDLAFKAFIFACLVNERELKNVGENKFKRYAQIILLTITLATVFFGTQILNLSFDYDFEKFYPANDDETEFFLDYRKQFKSDNDFLLVAIQRDKGIFNEAFLKEVDDFTKKIETLPDVNFVLSPTNQMEIWAEGTASFTERKYIDLEDIDLKRDSAGIYRCSELINSVVAEDAKSLCLFVRHEDFLSKEKSDRLITGVQKELKNFHFDNVRIAGRTIGQKYYIDKMTDEMILFVGLSAVLVIVFLVIAFRSVWGIVLPQVVIFSGMLWLIGGMGVFNEPINIILTVLPSVMFVVSMSDVIHLVSRYLDALRTNVSTYEAIQTAVREVGLATLLTSITTAVGFFSLIFVKVQPIQVFGIVMGIGVLIAFVLTFLLLPALFYFFPGPKYVRQKQKDSFWKRHLEKWFLIVSKAKWRVFIISVVVMGISVYGLFQINADNYLMDDLKASEPLKQDFNYLDDHYGGVRPFEMAVTLKDTSLTIWMPAVQQTLDSVEQYLANDYGLTIKTSLVSALKIANRSLHQGNPEYFQLPTKMSDRRAVREGLKSEEAEGIFSTFVAESQKLTRISGTIPDLGNKKVRGKNEKLLKFLESKTMNGAIEYRLTGTAHLIDKNMSYMSSSLVKGLAVSILIVAIIMGIVYRSTTILLISIVPNIVPLVFIAGLMGYMGIRLNISTAITFTIAFGIAVDDTIHYLGKFKYELMKGKSKLYALKRSYMTTGKAMILTTLILCSGFLLLVLSSFLGTFYLGVMLCVTLLIALIADLTLLPVLILIFYYPKRNKKKVD